MQLVKVQVNCVKQMYFCFYRGQPQFYRACCDGTLAGPNPELIEGEDTAVWHVCRVVEMQSLLNVRSMGFRGLVAVSESFTEVLRICMNLLVDFEQRPAHLKQSEDIPKTSARNKFLSFRQTAQMFAVSRENCRFT